MSRFFTLGSSAVSMVVLVAVVTGGAQARAGASAGDGMKVTKAMVDSTIAGWKAEPQKTARTIIAKYGLPQEVSANRLIWHDNGPWKITELVNEEVPHDFPMPHKDMLYQAISYRIDPGTADKLAKYDGSVVLERTKGEIAARCDKEEANFLALNLAHEVATGKRSVDDARTFYAASIKALMSGKPNDYVKGLRFEAPRANTGDRDKPVDGAGTGNNK